DLLRQYLAARRPPVPEHAHAGPGEPAGLIGLHQPTGNRLNRERNGRLQDGAWPASRKALYVNLIMLRVGNHIERRNLARRLSGDDRKSVHRDKRAAGREGERFGGHYPDAEARVAAWATADDDPGELARRPAGLRKQCRYGG